MARAVLRAQLRHERGKGAARRLRRAHKIPAVVYGKNNPGGQSIAVDGADVRRLLAGGGFGRLVELDLGADGRRVALAKDLQFDPVRGDVIHADFHEVALDEEVQAQVPVQVVNEEQRVNDGGIIGIAMREVTVSCLPTAIPEAISVDVSSLAIGDTVYVRDLTPPPGVQIVDDPDGVVLTVTAPAKAAADEDGGDEAGGEAASEDGQGEAASES